MTYQLILLVWIAFILKFNHACFKQSNEFNYLFVNDFSQIKIPLIPLDCFDCQTAQQVSRSIECMHPISEYWTSLGRYSTDR
jgi:hypothetical protein